jgi:hypothetical protein
MKLRGPRGCWTGGSAEPRPARYRSERVFRTLQDRLPKELALAGITAMAAANRYLAEQFLVAYNRRFAVPAPEAGTVFIPWIRHAPRRDSLCARRAGRGQGQDGAVSGPESADPARPAPVPLCEGHGAGPRIFGWDLGGVPWSPVSGARPCGWPAERDRTSPPRPAPYGSDVPPIVHPRPTVCEIISARD